MMSRPTVVRVALFLATVVSVWGVLSLGTAVQDLNLEEGAPSPQTFVAIRTVMVEDVVETGIRRQAARDAEPSIRRVDPERQDVAEANVNQVFDDIMSLVVDETGVEVVIPELPEPEEEVGEETATLTGLVFLDVDGNGRFEVMPEQVRVDRLLSGVRVTVTNHEGESTTMTNAQGLWEMEISPGPAVVVVATANGPIPTGWVPGVGEPAQLVECGAGETCDTGDLGFVVSLMPLDEVVAEFSRIHSNLPSDTVVYLAETAADDVIRAALGEPLHLPEVQIKALERMNAEFGVRITQVDLSEVQARARISPPFVWHSDTGRDLAGSQAAGEIVAAHLTDNYIVDPGATEQARAFAAADVLPVMVEVREGATIVREGDTLTRFHVDAVAAASSLRGVTEPASMGLLAVVAALVGVMGLYLAKFRQEIWYRPRLVALLGILILLAAAAVRATAAVADSWSWYILPAVTFGILTAILFDQRMALLMAMAVGVITAVGTFDLGLTVYAVLATMAPIPFVSSVTSRGGFRRAAAFSSATAAGVAVATSWFFHVGPNESWLDVVGQAALWAFAASMVASLIGSAALQFFESAFDITTSLSLLDLTDRNHEALQLIQEKAFGTFNHSLMVGTLADAAARAIGANPLLARAMAYYHDIGKTVNPTFFIENQFGMQNPHDMIDPRESAEILRSHVTEGVALARQFKIPTDVVQGIVSHHGDGVMRYFYEKARSGDSGEVDIDDFRHIGHKPRTAETAILMLADSLEAACRAVFQLEEPTPEAIEKVVARIIDEKVEDGQLSEAPLTLAELTQVRKAFLDSLVGHYHQRIAYPNFPGS